MIKISLLDILTGGKTTEAEDALKRAQADISGVQAPTAPQLTLPQLEAYVNAGVMTPEQATAALQGSNAFDTATVDPASMEAEMTALGQLQEVAKDKGMTPQMEAQLTAALNKASTNTQGERASIMDNMAKRGIPTSLMATAQQEAAAGEDAQTANLTSAQAAGAAEQNALAAMANAGTLGGNINSQEYAKAKDKAAAQNAINQWNAENTTSVGLTNTAAKNAARLRNTNQAQTLADTNTALKNERTQYNAKVPQTVFDNNLRKSAAEAGVSEQQANQDTAAGQQQAGVVSALIGGTSQMGAAAATPKPTYVMAAEGGEVEGGRRPRIVRTHDGGVHVMDDGGQVPGEPRVPGDSLKNDRVHALLSPGEVVVPRSITTAPNAPDRARQFVASLLKGPRQVRPMHPDDLHGLMSALERRREVA